MRTEIVFFVLFIIGLVFKLFSWPGGGILLIITFGTLAMLYAGGGVYFFSYKHMKNQIRKLSVFAGLSLSVCLIGILFTLMFWPGAEAQLMVGGFSALAIFVTSLVLQSKNTEEELKGYFRIMIIRTGLVGGMALVLFFTPLPAKIKFIYMHDPEMIELWEKAYENPENEQYQRELDEYQQEKRGRRGG